MAITIGLSKDELYDTFLMFSRYDGNLLNTFNHYLERYTKVYPDLFDDYRFNKLIFHFYDGQTQNKSLDFVDPITSLIYYGADINKIDPYMSQFFYYTTVFTEIVKQIIVDIQNQEEEGYESDEDYEGIYAYNIRQIKEIFNLLKLFVFTGIDENIGNPSFNYYIDNYYEETQTVREYGYRKFLKIYDMAKNMKMLFHAKQRSNFAKASLLPQNVLDSVFEHLDYDVPIEIGKRLYNNTNMLSNLNTFARFNKNETYPIYIHKKNERLRDNLRDVSMRPSNKKFAKRTIKNRKRHKRKY
jgi:hypothetical protein